MAALWFRGDVMNTEWIAVDWGTSHLRAWAMQGSTALDHAQSDKGMAHVGPDGFQAALLDLIDGATPAQQQSLQLPRANF